MAIYSYKMARRPVSEFIWEHEMAERQGCACIMCGKLAPSYDTDVKL